jgi:hypothetical protein
VSELREVSFAPFDLEEDLPPSLAASERPLWTWAVIGVMIGLLTGIIATTDLTAPPAPVEEGTPLTLPTDWPDAFAESPAEVFGSTPVRQTMVKESNGVNSMHVWLTDASVPFAIDGMPLAASTPVPDAANNYYLIHGELGDSLALFAGWEQFSTVSGRIPSLISTAASGFTWHESVEGYFTWTDIQDNDTTVVSSRYINAPPVLPVTLEGEWKVVWTAAQPGNPGTTVVFHVLQNENELLVIDQDGIEVGRVDIPEGSIIEGVVSGLILGHDPRGIDFAMTFTGEPADLPAWRRVQGELVTPNADATWIASWDGTQVQVSDVDGNVFRSIEAIGRPYWSNTGQYLTITQADQVVIFDIETADFSLIKPDGELVTAWVKDA